MCWRCWGGSCRLLRNCLSFAGNCRRNGRFNHDGDGRRRSGNGRACRNHHTCRRPGNNRPLGRAGSNGRLSGGRYHKLRSGAGLGDNPSRFRTRWGRGGCSDGSWRRGTRRCRDNRGCGGWGLLPDGRMRLPCLGFCFLLLGQNGLEHVARLRHIGEVNLWLNSLRRARRRAGLAGTRGALKLSTNFVRLVIFQRTRVSLTLGQAQLHQYVKDLTALDFHLACEIVDSNLTHPPLFKMCCPRRLVAHSYPTAMVGFQVPIIA